MARKIPARRPLGTSLEKPWKSPKTRGRVGAYLTSRDSRNGCVRGGHMERARHVAAVMATFVSIASCAAKSPASPTSLQPYAPPPETGSALPPMPTPIPGSVTISALTPSSGSTVKLRDCSHDGWEEICTEDVQVILAVVLERDLPRATIQIRFYDDALACVETWMNGVSLAAGVTQT